MLTKADLELASKKAAKEIATIETAVINQQQLQNKLTELKGMADRAVQAMTRMKIEEISPDQLVFGASYSGRTVTTQTDDEMESLISDAQADTELQPATP